MSVLFAYLSIWVDQNVCQYGRSTKIVKNKMYWDETNNSLITVLFAYLSVWGDNKVCKYDGSSKRAKKVFSILTRWENSKSRFGFSVKKSIKIA